MRDFGLLLSALYRPQTGYYNDLNEMGTALFESLITNRLFVDENKRIAFFGTDVIFRLNGYRFKVNVNDAYMFLTGLIEAGKCDFENLLPWVRNLIVSLRQPEYGSIGFSHFSLKSE